MLSVSFLLNLDQDFTSSGLPQGSAVLALLGDARSLPGDAVALLSRGCSLSQILGPGQSWIPLSPCWALQEVLAAPLSSPGAAETEPISAGAVQSATEKSPGDNLCLAGALLRFDTVPGPAAGDAGD